MVVKLAPCKISVFKLVSVAGQAAFSSFEPQIPYMLQNGVQNHDGERTGSAVQCLTMGTNCAPLVADLFLFVMKGTL